MENPSTSQGVSDGTSGGATTKNTLSNEGDTSSSAVDAVLPAASSTQEAVAQRLGGKLWSDLELNRVFVKRNAASSAKSSGIKPAAKPNTPEKGMVVRRKRPTISPNSHGNAIAASLCSPAVEYPVPSRDRSAAEATLNNVVRVHKAEYPVPSPLKGECSVDDSTPPKRRSGRVKTPVSYGSPGSPDYGSPAYHMPVKRRGKYSPLRKRSLGETSVKATVSRGVNKNDKGESKPPKQKKRRTNETTAPSVSVSNKNASIKDFVPRNKTDEKWKHNFILWNGLQSGTITSDSTDDTNQLAPNWVDYQRTQYSLFKQNKATPMDQMKVDILTNAGFFFSKREEKWHDNFQKWKDAKSTNDRATDEMKKWVSNQRLQYWLWRGNDTSSLNEEKVALMEKAGFQWGKRKGKQDGSSSLESVDKSGEVDHGDAQHVSSVTKSSNIKDDDVKASVDTNNHTGRSGASIEDFVPRNKVDEKWKQNFIIWKGLQSGSAHPNIQLAPTWIDNQRTNYYLFQQNKPTSMDQQKIDILSSAGFFFSKRKEKWHIDFQKWKHAKSNNTETEDSRNFVKKQRHHMWLLTQNKSSSLTDERIALLVSAGFDWGDKMRRKETASSVGRVKNSRANASFDNDPTVTALAASPRSRARTSIPTQFFHNLGFEKPKSPSPSNRKKRKSSDSPSPISDLRRLSPSKLRQSSIPIESLTSLSGGRENDADIGSDVSVDKAIKTASRLPLKSISASSPTSPSKAVLKDDNVQQSACPSSKVLNSTKPTSPSVTLAKPSSSSSTTEGVPLKKKSLDDGMKKHKRRGRHQTSSLFSLAQSATEPFSPSKGNKQRSKSLGALSHRELEQQLDESRKKSAERAKKATEVWKKRKASSKAQTDTELNDDENKDSIGNHNPSLSPPTSPESPLHAKRLLSSLQPSVQEESTAVDKAIGEPSRGGTPPESPADNDNSAANNDASSLCIKTLMMQCLDDDNAEAASEETRTDEAIECRDDVPSTKQTSETEVGGDAESDVAPGQILETANTKTSAGDVTSLDVHLPSANKTAGQENTVDATFDEREVPLSSSHDSSSDDKDVRAAQFQFRKDVIRGAAERALKAKVDGRLPHGWYVAEIKALTAKYPGYSFTERDIQRDTDKLNKMVGSKDQEAKTTSKRRSASAAVRAANDRSKSSKKTAKKEIGNSQPPMEQMELAGKSPIAAETSADLLESFSPLSLTSPLRANNLLDSTFGDDSEPQDDSLAIPNKAHVPSKRGDCSLEGTSLTVRRDESNDEHQRESSQSMVVCNQQPNDQQKLQVAIAERQFQKKMAEFGRLELEARLVSDRMREIEERMREINSSQASASDDHLVPYQSHQAISRRKTYHSETTSVSKRTRVSSTSHQFDSSEFTSRKRVYGHHSDDLEPARSPKRRQNASERSSSERFKEHSRTSGKTRERMSSDDDADMKVDDYGQSRSPSKHRRKSPSNKSQKQSFYRASDQDDALVEKSRHSKHREKNAVSDCVDTNATNNVDNTSSSPSSQIEAVIANESVNVATSHPSPEQNLITNSNPDEHGETNQPRDPLQWLAGEGNSSDSDWDFEGPMVLPPPPI